MPSLSPITPSGTVSRTVTAASANVALAKSGLSQLMVTSAATNAIAFINVGTSNAVTAAVTDTPILPGTVQVFTIPFDATHVAAIGTTGTTLYFTVGEGQ